MTGALWILVPIGVFVALYLWQRLATRGAGGKLLGNLEALYQGAHDYREVSLEDFPHLDHGYYREMTAALEGLGFRSLGDVEDLTASAAGPGLPTACRTLVSGDGKTLAGIYWLNMPGPIGLLLRLFGQTPARVVDLETPLDDGHFLLTSNAEGAGALDSPPEIHDEFLPRETAPAALWARHRERLADLERRAPPVRGLVTSDLAAANRHQQTIDEIKARFRKARPGLLSLKEMARMAGAHQKREADALHAELLRQQQARSETTPPATRDGDGRPNEPS